MTHADDDITDDQATEFLLGCVRRAVPIVNQLNFVLSEYETEDVIPALGLALALQARNEEQVEVWFSMMATFAHMYQSGAISVQLSHVPNTTSNPQ